MQFLRKPDIERVILRQDYIAFDFDVSSTAAVAEMPEFPDIQSSQIPIDLNIGAVRLFIASYKECCQSVLTTIQSLRFSEVAGLFIFIFLIRLNQFGEIIGSL